MKRVLLRAALCLLGITSPFCASASVADPDLDVKVQIVGEEIRAQVSLFVRASQQRVWEVITDYERAPEFTREILASKVVSRTGDTLRLLQKAQFRFGPFMVPVDTVRDVRLVRPVRTESRLVEGSMRKHDATTELVAEPGGTRVIVRSLAIPGAFIAGFISQSMVRRETEEHFRQLRAEILRREHHAALARP